YLAFLTYPSLIFTSQILFLFFFFFNTTPPTEIYTLSLHDALPISRLHRLHGRGKERRGRCRPGGGTRDGRGRRAPGGRDRDADRDRKSTRLNSSHVEISYAVFCLKKKKKKYSSVYKDRQDRVRLNR